MGRLYSHAHGFSWPCTTTMILPVAFVLLTLEKNDVFYSLSPASSRCATLACSHCMRSWPRGGTPRQALAHSKFILHSTSTFMVTDSPDTHNLFTVPPGAILSTTQVGILVDSCHSPSTSASAHEVGHPLTYPRPHT